MSSHTHSHTHTLSIRLYRFEMIGINWRLFFTSVITFVALRVQLKYGCHFLKGLKAKIAVQKSVEHKKDERKKEKKFSNDQPVKCDRSIDRSAGLSIEQF